MQLKMVFYCTTLNIKYSYTTYLQLVREAMLGAIVVARPQTKKYSGNSNLYCRHTVNLNIQKHSTQSDKLLLARPSKF